MNELKITIEGVDRLIGNVEATADAQLKALAAALYQEAESIMSDSKPLVPVDLNTLRSSGYVAEPVIENDKVTVTLGYGGAAAEYAVYVHEGTGPAVGRPAYWPPLAALEGWAHRHGFKDARAVQWAIHEHGTQPIKYLEIPFNAHKNGIEDRIAERIAAALK